jgi:outer membrane lipoprotein carrier protein
MRHASCAVATLLLLFSFGTSAFGKSTVVEQIQRHYETITSFQAEFVQELRVAASRESEERRGLLFYQQPGLIRWETQAPEEELLVVGPKEVWNYFAQEGTAYRYSSSEVLDSSMILRILSGQARLDQDFLVEEDLVAENGWRKLRLVPRNPEPNLVEAAIWVDEQTFLLRRLLVVDFFGNTNQITLHDLRLNPALDPALFTFTPPEGVMVLDNF